MLHELLNESNYNSTCDASVQQIVDCYFEINRKYIDEFVRHESMCKDDFYTGCVIIRHVFNVLLSTTMNIPLTESICLITIMYYIEFVSQIHSSKYGQSMGGARIHVCEDEDSAPGERENGDDAGSSSSSSGGLTSPPRPSGSTGAFGPASSQAPKPSSLRFAKHAVPEPNQRYPPPSAVGEAPSPSGTTGTFGDGEEGRAAGGLGESALGPEAGVRKPPAASPLGALAPVAPVPHPRYRWRGEGRFDSTSASTERGPGGDRTEPNKRDPWEGVLFASLNARVEQEDRPTGAEGKELPTPGASLGDAANYVITHRDITLFVYNKTLSNLNRHFAKSNRSTEKKLARSDYYTRMYMLIIRHVLVSPPAKTLGGAGGDNVSEEQWCRQGGGANHPAPPWAAWDTDVGLTETEMSRTEKKRLPILGKKITDMFKMCLFTHTQCLHLQSLLILMEYISMYSSRTSLKYIQVIVRLFPAMIQRRSEDAGQFTPGTAMARATSAEFMYNVRSLTPHAFLKWFVLYDI